MDVYSPLRPKTTDVPESHRQGSEKESPFLHKLYATASAASEVSETLSVSFAEFLRAEGEIYSSGLWLAEMMYLAFVRCLAC